MARKCSSSVVARSSCRPTALTFRAIVAHSASDRTRFGARGKYADNCRAFGYHPFDRFPCFEPVPAPTQRPPVKHPTDCAASSTPFAASSAICASALSQESAASLNELAERTLTDQSSVSVVVKRLVARNLVTRRPSRIDARRVELALTASGRKLLAKCPEPTQVKLVSALRRLTARELQDLTVGLGGLVREMGLDKKAAGMFFDEESPSGAVRAARRTPR